MEQQITVPLAGEEEALQHTGYEGRSFVTIPISCNQACTLRRMVIAMQKRNIEVVMPGGRLKRVENRADAIRWLLDRVGDEA